MPQFSGINNICYKCKGDNFVSEINFTFWIIVDCSYSTLTRSDWYFIPKQNNMLEVQVCGVVRLAVFL